MRWLKRLTLLLLLIVVAAGAWISTRDLNLSEWLPEIEAAVRDATGRELKVTGDLELDLFPKPTVSVQGLSFSNADWGSRPVMMSAEQVLLTLKLRPLLFGEARVKAMTLDTVQLLIETNAQGQGNWEFDVGANGGSSTSGALDMLDRLDVDNVEIEWREAGSKPHNARFDIVRLKDNGTGGFDILVDGELGGRPRRLEGSLSALSEYLQGNGLKGRVTSTTPNLVSKFEGDLGRFPAIDGIDVRIEAEGSRWPMFSKATGLPTGDTPPWTIAFHASGDGGVLTLSELAFHDPDSAVTGGLQIDRNGEGSRIKGIALQVDAKGEKWPYLATLMGTPDGPLPPWHVKFHASGDEDLIELTEIDSLLDKSDLAGTLKIDLRGSVAQVSGKLISKTLDVSTPERWWQGTLEHDRSIETGGKLFSTDPIQTGWMEKVDVDLDIEAGSLKTDDLAAENATIALLIKDKVMDADVKADVYGGRGESHFTADGSAPTLVYSQRMEIIDADMKGVTESWFGAGLVDAPGRLRYEIKGSGTNAAEIMAGLSGSGTLVLGEGTARAGVAERAVRGLATTAFATLLQEKKIADVKMNCLVSEVAIADGIANFEVLVLDTERATVVGSGHVDLGKETWDLFFKPKPKTFALNAAVPVRMHGPFHSPEISAQKVGVLRKLAGAVSLFVFPPAAVAGLAEFGAGNPCVELVESASPE